MGVVAKEAGKASIALVLGIGIGTINTMFVLPRAFEGAEEYWGLIRVLTAWSSIVTPVLMFGGGGILLRNSRKIDPSLRGSLHGSVWLISAIGLLLWGIALAVGGQNLMTSFDAEKGGLLNDHLILFFFMTVLVLGSNLIATHLAVELKGSWSHWVGEVWLKASYLILALMLWWGLIDFETMVYAYVGTWVVGLLAKAAGLVAYRVPISFRKLRQIEWKNNLQYGAYASLTSGAGSIASNLDFVMVGSLLGLSVVPVYTIGFFIGSVVALPQRALGTVFTGLMAKNIAEQGVDQMEPFARQVVRVNIILATVTLVGVWAGMKPLLNALPPAYQGITGVVLAIGIQKIVNAMGQSTSAILAHTPLYRLNLPMNLGMLVATVATNWLCMSVLNMGVTGAAIATLLTSVWSTTWRIAVLKRKLNIQPYTRSWVSILAIGFSVAFVFTWVPGDLLGHGYIQAGIQGTMASGTVLAITYFTGLFPELKTAVEQRILSRFR